MNIRSLLQNRLLVSLFLLPAALLAAPPESKSNVSICHIPPGNPGKAQVITVSASALNGHLAHGDFEGETCETRSLLSNAADKYAEVDPDSGLVSATAANPAPPAARFLIEEAGGVIRIRSVANGKYLSFDPQSGFVSAAETNPASATNWLIFVVAEAVGSGTRAIIIADGPGGPNVDFLQYDPDTAALRVVNRSIIEGIADPNTEFTIF